MRVRLTPFPGGRAEMHRGPAMLMLPARLNSCSVKFHNRQCHLLLGHYGPHWHYWAPMSGWVVRR